MFGAIPFSYKKDLLTYKNLQKYIHIIQQELQ